MNSFAVRNQIQSYRLPQHYREKENVADNSMTSHAHVSHNLNAANSELILNSSYQNLG
jgi:hypothetical protein